MKKTTLPYINLNNTDSIKKCSERCKLEVDYSLEPNATITNLRKDKNGGIVFTYVSPIKVLFNGEPHNNTFCSIIKPPIHKYKQDVVAELNIMHSSRTELLILIIPIVKKNTTHSFLSEVLNTNETSKTSSTLNLTNVVPKSSYHYYKGPMLGLPLSNNIIFPANVGLGITQEDLDKIPNLEKNKFVFFDNTSNVKLFNNNGLNVGDDDIYIDCNPVDDNGNTIKNKYDTANMDTGKLMKSVGIIVGIIGAILLIGIAYLVYKKMGNKSIPNMKDMKDITVNTSVKRFLKSR